MILIKAWYYQNVKWAEKIKLFSVSLAKPQLASPTEITAEAKATPVFITVCVCDTRIAYQKSKLTFSATTALILIQFDI